MMKLIPNADSERPSRDSGDSVGRIPEIADEMSQPGQKALREEKPAFAPRGVSEKPVLQAGKDLAKPLVGEKIADNHPDSL